MRYSKESVESARKMLAEMLKPGDVVYAQVTHVARSGMSRRIKLHLIVNNQPFHITYHVARLLDYPENNQGILVSGCGMDMCFHVIYTLGRVLFPKGFKLPEGKIGRNGNTSGFDSDGGYALDYRSI